MPLDALLQSRPGLGLVIVLQMVSASFALGLAGYLLVLEGLWRTTGAEPFQKLRGLWSRGFLIALALTLLAAGFEAFEGALGPAWQATLSNFPYRTAELLDSALLATALVVGAVSAWRLLKDPHDIESCLALRMAVGMFVICAPLELALGDGITPRPNLVIGLAAAVALLGVWGGVLFWRGTPQRSPVFLGACVAMGAVGLLAPTAEWLGAGGLHA